MKNIFIAHSVKDKDFVKQMHERLTHAGFRPWIDPNPRPGDDWRFEFDDAIRHADAVIVIITPNAVGSPYVTYEWSFALGVGARVIPVVYKAADMHPRLISLTKFDYLAWKDPAHFWDYFLRELHTLLNAPIAAAPPPLPPTAEAVASQQRPHVPNVNRTVMPTEAGHWLVIRRGPNLNSMFKLDKYSIMLGRDVTNDIAINDPEVSRQHLRITTISAGITIEEMGSTNGTFVNGVKLSGQRTLNNGDIIGLGDAIVLTYEVVK